MRSKAEALPARAERSCVSHLLKRGESFASFINASHLSANCKMLLMPALLLFVTGKRERSGSSSLSCPHELRFFGKGRCCRQIQLWAEKVTFSLKLFVTPR